MVLHKRSSNDGSLLRSPTTMEDGVPLLDGGGKQGKWSRPAASTSTLTKWWELSTLWFQSTERWKAIGYAATVITTSFLTTWLLVRISYAQRNFSTALSERKVEDFYRAVWEFVEIIIIAAPLFAFSNFVYDRLVLAWRAFMTRTLLHAYFSDKAYFHVSALSAHLDNPDQRICNDVDSFVGSTTMLVLSVLKKGMNLVAFAGVLWSVSPKLVYMLLMYAGAGTWATAAVFGKRLMRLHFVSLQREADMRFSLVRVRENAESIAFYGGEKREASAAHSRFDAVLENKRDLVKWGSFLELWNNVYQYATILVPSLLTAPRYFAGEIEFGVVTQAGFAFGRIEAALSVIIQNIDRLSGLTAETQRLHMLLQAVKHGSDAVQVVAPEIGHHLQDAITRIEMPAGGPNLLNISNLDLKVPFMEVPICRSFQLSVAKGESVLVVGPSGCGKSSLLRAIAGLWTRGSGTIQAPPKEAVFFLPQKPFMPLGSLRTQLTFPNVGTAADVPNSRLEELLDEVALGDILARTAGGWTTMLDWSSVLSLGEQQRVAALRLILHEPSLAFLDEATSAMDHVTERKVYSALRSHCDAYVSVGHRMQLLQYHSHVLTWQGKGRWRMCSVEEYQSELATEPSGNPLEL